MKVADVVVCLMGFSRVQRMQGRGQSLHHRQPKRVLHACSFLYAVEDIFDLLKGLFM